VAILTVAWEGILHGMTATSFTTVSFRPPIILVCLHRLSRTHRFTQASGYFAINFLTENQFQWSDRFAGRQPEIDDRFAGIELVTGVTGAPILADCAAWLECRVTASHAAGDHTIFVADVVAVVGAVWLSPLGLAFNIAYALVAGYLGIVVGRRVLGRKNL